MTAHTQHPIAPCSRSVERAAQKELVATGYYPLKSLNCRFSDGTLTLQGQVPSYFHKQMAQEAIRRVGSIQAIVNEIKVPL